MYHLAVIAAMVAPLDRVGLKDRAMARLAPIPCIDGMWYDEELGRYADDGFWRAVCWPYLKRRLAEPHELGYPYAAYTEATLDFFGALYDAGVPEADLAWAVERMRRGDALWLEANHAGRPWWAEVWRSR